MKLYFGSKNNQPIGFINIDIDCQKPCDQTINLEVFPWPWRTNSISEIIFDYTLELIGEDTHIFLSIIKELHRVCMNGAIITIKARHPLHELYYNNPSCVRPITPKSFNLFNKNYNNIIIKTGSPDTPLACFNNVDFDIINVITKFNEDKMELIGNDPNTVELYNQHTKEHNNIIKEFNIELRVKKIPIRAAENRKIHDWIIVTEPYKELSNGILSMHKICDYLNKTGDRAFLLFLSYHDDASQRQLYCSSDPSLRSPKLNTPPLPKNKLTKAFLNNCIVFYPEALIGNPLESKRVVRYLGNRPGYCTPGHVATFNNNDFLLAHSKIFIPNPNAVLFNATQDPTFIDDSNREFYDRSLDLIYHGKGPLHAPCEIFDNTLLVERVWPRSRKQLSLLLKQARFFYTYDSWSNINVEALMSGCVPVFLRYEPWSADEIASCELGSIPCGQLREIHNNTIFADVDINKFLRDKRDFLNRLDLLNSTWDQRLEDTVTKMRAYFD